jgi:hypothetical protein
MATTTRVKSVRINPAGIAVVLNGPRAQAYLAEQAHRVNAEALKWYLVQQKGMAELPILYVRSFKIRRVRKRAVASWEAYNDDPTALWVEFGAHAGGKTAVLKYHPYGRALESLRIR